MPIIMEISPHERFLGGRSAPQIVVNRFGDGLRPADFADAASPCVTKSTRTQNLANVPFAHPGNRLGNAAAGARLSAGLHDAIVFARRFNKLPTLPDIVGNGLFDVNIFAGLDGPN